MRNRLPSWRQQLLSSVRAFPIGLAGGGAIALSAFAFSPAALAQSAPPAPPAQDAQPPAQAQNTPPAAKAPAADSQVDDVVITARDRAEKAQDVPLSLSALGSKTTDRQHIDSFKDVIQAEPSFTPAIANPRTGANGLRGITGISGGADGSEGDVGLIVDNVFYSYIGFSFFTLYDIDSLTIARGPQGTLLGKNTTAGAVIINTKSPSFTPETTTESTFGSRHLLSEKFSTTGTLVPDTIAYRLSFLRAYQDGFLPNIEGGDLKAQDTNRWDIRGQLLGTFGDITDRLIFEHGATAETNNGSGTWNENYTSTYGIPTSYKTTTSAGTLALPTESAALARLFPQYASLITPNAWATNNTNYGPIFTHTNGASNELNWQLGNYTLTSVTAFRQFDFHPENSDGNYGINAVTGNISGFDVNVDQYSQETRISSPKGGPVDFTAGTYFLREDIWSKDRIQFGSDAVTLQTFNNTNTGAYASNILNGVESDLDGKATITSAAPFLQANYHYDEHAQLTLGIRDSYEVRTSSDNGYYFGGATLGSAALNHLRELYVVNQGLKGTDFTGADSIAGTQRTNSISFLINPSYKFNDNVTTYAVVARGVKSGAANTVAVPIYGPTTGTGLNQQLGQVIGTQSPITKPEISMDYEVGIKTDWLDRKLQLNADLYWNDITDFQAVLSQPYTYQSNGNSVLVYKSYLGNVPAVRLAGAEFEGRYSPLENLWINFSGAYNGAWYVSYPLAPAPADLNAVNGGLPVNLSGQKVPGVTPVTLILGANYEHSLASLVGHDIIGYVYGNQAYHSKTTYSLDASYTEYVLTQSAYSIFNAGIGFKTPDSKYDISFWGKNIFNRQAVSSFGQSASASIAAPSLGSPYGSITFVDPQTFGVTLRAVF
ncbi:MAG: TonB-dependent receptor [Beijerinckiaceae bacterium]